MFKAAAIALLTVLFCTTALAQSRAVNTIKNGNFKACPGKTVNQAVNSLFNQPVWESGTGASGETLIDLTGTVKYGREMMSAYMQFELKPGGGFKVNGLKLNGRQMDDKFVLQFIELMCE